MQTRVINKTHWKQRNEGFKDKPIVKHLYLSEITCMQGVRKRTVHLFSKSIGVKIEGFNGFEPGVLANFSDLLKDLENMRRWQQIEPKCFLYKISRVFSLKKKTNLKVVTRRLLRIQDSKVEAIILYIDPSSLILWSENSWISRIRAS